MQKMETVFLTAILDWLFFPMGHRPNVGNEYRAQDLYADTRSHHGSRSL